MMAIVVTMRCARRPYFSARGPETRVKTPKNTTPMMSITRNVLRAKPSPGTSASVGAVP